jgi:hypothetical protein
MNCHPTSAAAGGLTIFLHSLEVVVRISMPQRILNSASFNKGCSETKT